MEYRYACGDESAVVQVEAVGDGYTVTVNGRAYGVRLTTNPARPGELALAVDGSQHLAWVAADGPRRWVALSSQPCVLTVPQAGPAAAGARPGGHDTLEAQMPGVVRRVLVAAGERVERGQVLVLLEAMKMEIRVTAPHAGRVEAVSVEEGQAVERGQRLVEVESEP